MDAFEKLGAFYLGAGYDLARGERTADLTLYDSRDLTTHAVIVGMTGSGKTGLGIGLLEEAAMDGIPVLAIDPKGDLGNILLTFPDLRPGDFRPWINPQDAEARGVDADTHAAAQAALWRKGLADWGQGPDRIGRLRQAAELAIYTPGSDAGRPLSVLRSFRPPSDAVQQDGDLYRDRIEATATGLLALIGLEADPITSREHILLATILQHAWDAGQTLDLAGVIGAVQQPPVDRVGVLDVESFFPGKERFALAMRLNNLLAAPGFGAWMEGAPLDIAGLLHTPAGRPRVAVLSIAHLSDAERMFFVTMLLTEVLAWMRTQPGTTSLRALLYMDELFGFMPPVANPPSKKLFLTLLKQARAYGVGLALATQNPVDLDYKGLSNTGTWFIGRLQTERDKARLLEGLEGAAAGGTFDRGRMEQVLAGLGKRVFLMHNVHEDEPVVFTTRWVMSYLAGPMTRDQIRQAMRDDLDTGDGESTAVVAAPPSSLDAGAGAVPVLSPDIAQFYLPLAGTAPPQVEYHPGVVAAAEVAYRHGKAGVDERRRLIHLAEVAKGPVPLVWSESEAAMFRAEDLATAPVAGAVFAPLPRPAAEAKSYRAWGKEYLRWIRTEHPLVLWHHQELGLYSRADESERAFRVRLQLAMRERRDAEVDALRAKYAVKVTRLEERLRRAEQSVEREGQQASARMLDAALSAGTALLGSLLGRKKVSVTNLRRVGTAVRGAGRIKKERGDVKRAEETAAAAAAALAALERELADEVERLESVGEAQHVPLAELAVKAKSADVSLQLIGVCWRPYRRNAAGGLAPAWATDR